MLQARDTFSQVLYWLVAFREPFAELGAGASLTALPAGTTQEYKLVSDTLFLAISYVDRFLSMHAVPRAKLQLVGVACMLLAAKYEEIYAPQARALLLA